jgi:hypothetical protein
VEDALILVLAAARGLAILLAGLFVLSLAIAILLAMAGAVAVVFCAAIVCALGLALSGAFLVLLTMGVIVTPFAALGIWARRSRKSSVRRPG